MKSIQKHKEAKGGQAVVGIVRSEEKREFANEEEKRIYEERMNDEVDSGKRLPGRSYRLTTTTEATYDIIHRLEEALTRCQSQKQKCIESLNKLRIERGKSDENNGGNAPSINIICDIPRVPVEQVSIQDPFASQAVNDVIKEIESKGGGADG